ncbi:DUF21 domain-containing protein At2g14520-like [Camellia sinensis]|uniref:DUF21 domain-containing protein At2g14520-like n=1 Tax=Camellia sinensis TaxID=4442 RepID=UPI001036A70E|nr:DUF21 domain-containing protein At2g14520-like [Camellia sinensis]
MWLLKAYELEKDRELGEALERRQLKSFCSICILSSVKDIKVVRKQHLLLCTLLICNAAAMETLPIFLDSLVTAWGAILISVTLILLFGEAGKGGELTHDETTIIAGALGLTEKTASDAMTPISDTFAVDINAKLDRELMNLILEKGHRRVPVYYEQPTNIIGLVLVNCLFVLHVI